MSSNLTNRASSKVSDFGRRLKAAFNQSSNKVIAKQLNVSEPALTAYIQGRIPPPDKLVEIAKITRCNLNWLLTGEGTKKNTPQIERPQGLIIQGSKGGIGSSFSATMIAAVLALKGFRVLIADDIFHSIAHLLLANQDSGSKIDSLRGKLSDRFDEYHVPTRNINLELFIPSFWKFDYPPQIKNKFDFNFSEINEKYDFVIFDVQRIVNPFGYPHYFLETFSLEPILRNARVLIPFQPFVSRIDQLETSLKYIETQKNIYPDADLLGVFLVNNRTPRQEGSKEFREVVKQLKDTTKSAVFNTAIDYHKDVIVEYKELEQKIFSRKTKIYKNFSQLVDEILNKLGLNQNQG